MASSSTLDEAKAAYEELKAVGDRRTLRVDGVVVLTHDDDGRLTVVKVTDPRAEELQKAFEKAGHIVSEVVAKAGADHCQPLPRSSTPELTPPATCGSGR